MERVKMNAEQQAFLNALEDNPCDWDTRMVYADWLDDHDQPEEATRQRKWKEAYQTALKVVRPYAGEFPEDGEPDVGHVLKELDYSVDSAFKYGEVCFGYDDSSQIMYGDPGLEREFWEAVEVLTGKPNPMNKREEINYRCAC